MNNDVEGSRTLNRQQALPRKRISLDSTDMNTAYKSPKNPKIQALINETVNDETQQKKEVDGIAAKPSALVRQKERVIEKILRTPTPHIIAEVFEEKVLPSLPSEVVAEVFQRKVLPKPSPRI